MEVVEDKEKKLDGVYTFFAVLKSFVAATFVYLPKVF